MKFSLLLAFCLAFALAESFAEKEFLEDENDLDKRHFPFPKGCKANAHCGKRRCCWKNKCRAKRWGRPCFPSCQTNDDCGSGECCWRNKCRAKRKEGQLCKPNSSCFKSCQDHLECRKIFFFIFKCKIPEEPGSGAGN